LRKGLAQCGAFSVWAVREKQPSAVCNTASSNGQPLKEETVSQQVLFSITAKPE
jgi:hypothetical protein